MADHDPTPRANGATPGAGGTYQALYRRYRPQRFADVRGQEHVTRALRNAVREDRVAHAYLFSGPRGTGKTSTARILAMALNCDNAVDGEPDGTCQSCVAVRSGSSMDVFELDAASNRKLDEMRDLLSRVALGTPGRWKVYIVDEVHQLTPDAASALLKTLEEPPSHVVFVLATTDPQKVLPTIQSRTQHFEFHLLDGEVLAGLLDDINHDADLGLSADVVRLAVQKGRGSARDAESALEQLAAAGGEPDDGAPLVALVLGLAERDTSAVLQAVAQAIASGKDPRRFGSDLVEHLREAFLANQAPSLVLRPAADIAGLAEEASQLGLPLLVRSMETIGLALVDMRDSVDPRVTLEVALVRLASPAADTSPGALLERIERLERALGDGALPARSTGPRAGEDPASAPLEPARTSARALGEIGEPPVTAVPALAAGAQPASVQPAPTTLAQPTQPGGPGEARAALGALLRGASKTSAPSPPRPAQSATPAEPATGPVEEAAPSPGWGGEAPERVAGLGRSGQSGADAGAAPPGAGEALPTRDELTKAWGDKVLASLGRPAQAYMGQGRFTEVSDVAVFALPDMSWVERASRFVAEAEGALAGHFGRPVPLRIVADKGAPPPRARREASPEESYDLEEIADAPSVEEVSIEQRILNIFPGAVVES